MEDEEKDLDHELDFNPKKGKGFDVDETEEEVDAEVVDPDLAIEQSLDKALDEEEEEFGDEEEEVPW